MSVHTCYTIMYVAPPHAHHEIMVDEDIVDRPGFDIWAESPVEHKIVRLPNSFNGYWRYSSPFEIKITRNAADIPNLLTIP